MKTFLLLVSLCICSHTFADQIQDFEKNYNELSETLHSSIALKISSINEEVFKSTNVSCLSALAKLNFLSYIIDNFDKYEVMLKKNDLKPPGLDEFKMNRTRTIREIEQYKKELMNTGYNCN